MRHRLVRSLAASAALALGLAGAGSTAHAAVTFVATPGGSAQAGASYASFDGFSLGSATQSDGGVTASFGGGATVMGGVPNQYAAPNLSGLNNQFFGGPGIYTGLDKTNYLTTLGSPGIVTLTFATVQNYLGILWGSTDTYNTLTFLDADGNSLGAFTGADVNPPGNGDQGTAGTVYVNFQSTTAYKTVVITSGQPAFEFDDVAYGAVPEPASMAMCGTALVAGCGAALRRRKTAKA